MTIAGSHENPSDSGSAETTISLNSLTELNAGQTVYVEWGGGSGAYLLDNSINKYTHFTGELIARA